MSNRQAIVETLVTRLSASSGDGHVCLMTGEWGVGKSYLWREDVVKGLGEGQGSVITVSAFGVGDEQQLRRRLFMCSLKNRAAQMAEGDAKKALSGFGSTVWGSLKKAADNVLGTDFISAQVDIVDLIDDGAIICIDDLERSAEGLDMRCILGLANYLAEVKRCRVLLIAAEQGLGANDEAQLKLYRERVVDTYLVLETPLSTARNWILPSQHKAADESSVKAFAPHHDVVIAKLDEAGHVNLRTLRRILTGLWEVHLALGEALEPSHIECYVALMVETADGRLEPDEAFYRRAQSALSFGGSKEPDEDRRSAFLSRHYGSDPYSFDFSPALYDFVRNGALDTQALKAEITPEEVPQSRLQTLVAQTQESEWFFFSDAEYVQWLRALADVLSESLEDAAFTVLRAALYARIAEAKSGTKPESETWSTIRSSLTDKAERGESIDSGFFGAEARAYVGELLVEYQEAYDLKAVERTEQELRTLLEKRDIGDLLRALRFRPKLATMMAQPGVLRDLKGLHAVDRMFFFRVLQGIAEALSKLGEQDLSALAAWEAFRDFLEKTTMWASDNSDQLRFVELRNNYPPLVKSDEAVSD